MFHGDLSAGSTEGTYSLGAFADYRMGAHHLIAGYKHFELEVEASGGDEVTTQTFSGPMNAYGYSFQGALANFGESAGFAQKGSPPFPQRGKITVPYAIAARWTFCGCDTP